MKWYHYGIALLLLRSILMYGAAEATHVETYKVSVNAYKSIMGNLREAKIRFPKVVLAQIMLETDQLRSLVYTNCNNVTGMKHNARGYSKGTCRGHAKYDSVSDCLRDYRKYQQVYLHFYEYNRLYRSVVTDDEYIQFLSWISYAEDPLYATKLRTWMKIIDKTEIIINLERNLK